MEVEPIEYDWEELYPDSLRKIRHLIAPHRVVIDYTNQPRIPDEKCIIVKWTDENGEHIERFLKEDPEQIPKLMEEIQNARNEVKKQIQALENPNSEKI